MAVETLFDAGIKPVDELYRIIRDVTKYADSKAFTESLWSKFKPFADKDHFQREIYRDFHARFWEMYLFHALNDAGHTLGASKKSHGPDLFIEHQGSKIWVEAVIAKRGDGVDAPAEIDEGLAEIAPGVRGSFVKSLSDDAILLRYCTAISFKYGKYLKYLKDGIISDNDPFVIALNGASVPFDFVKDDLPRVAKALFGLGEEQYIVDPKTMKILSRTYTFKPKITKQSGSEVATDIFLNDGHSGISAIIYTCKNVANYRLPIGSDFVIMHNPFAKNPLGLKYLNFGTEYWVEGDQLKF